MERPVAMRTRKQADPLARAATEFTVYPEIGEALDPDVTPVLRPTLVFGREHVYQNEYDIAELKRKLRVQNTLPMPTNCVALLESVCLHLKGSLSADALHASLSPLTSEDLAVAIDYCVQQKWLNAWSGVIQVTYEGVNALNKQLAFNAAAGKIESWPGLSRTQKALLVARVAGECGCRTVLGIAQAVAEHFRPSANAESIRNWLNRNEEVRRRILRKDTGRSRRAPGK